MTTRFAGHLLTGDHASRPAFGDVPEGTLYACSDHALIYQSDGVAAWSTWSTVSGTALVAAHTGDASDAHDASAISILDAANDFTATDVEGALAELQADNEAHVAAADPHTGYRLESADHTHASTGAQAGTVDHGVLTGLTDDDHPQYVKDSEFGAKGRILAGTGSGTFDDLPVGTNGDVLTADSGETMGVKWAAAAGGGAVATDAIWDAKGDVAGGTGANTAARLAVGGNGAILEAASGETTGLKWSRTLRGKIQGSDGAVLQGTGFTCARNATGDYTITITSAFAAAPIVVGTVITVAGSRWFTADNVTTTSIHVYIASNLALVDLDFCFIAIAAS